MKSYDVYVEASDMFEVEAENEEDAKKIAIEVFFMNPTGSTVNVSIQNERNLENLD